MLQIDFHPSPNPLKAALLLEELQTPFELIAVDTFEGEQHLPSFLKINPNAKVPATRRPSGRGLHYRCLLRWTKLREWLPGSRVPKPHWLRAPA